MVPGITAGGSELLPGRLSQEQETLHPDWTLLHRELIRAGHAWVGVTAQKAGVDGGGFVVTWTGQGSGDVGDDELDKGQLKVHAKDASRDRGLA